MGELRKFYLRGTLTADRDKSSNIDDFSHRLAAEIVVGAIKDWRQLISRRAWLETAHCRKNFNELRLFFKGEWCAFLLSDFETEPEKILEVLEAELREAMEKDTIRKNKMKRGNR